MRWYALALGAYLVALILTFRGYVTGSAVPPWDFMGGGHVEAFRWYLDGSLLNPPSWFPYAWFGLPEHQLVQNGGWVLPIAITAELFSWTPRNATLVQFFYIWLGGVSTFVLSRVLRFSYLTSFLVGFIYLFSVMNISNAQHSSMLRAAALLPLLIAVSLPAWILKSPWLVLISGLVWWQAIVSSYPGNLITTFCLAMAVIAVSFWKTPRSVRPGYLMSLLVAIGGGLLLAAPRWLPVLFDRQSFPIERVNTAILTWELIPTLVSSYDLPGLPNDVTMRSIWLAPLSFCAIFFLRRRNFLGLFSAIVMTFSLLMMTELPLVAQIKDTVSIFRISTFAISDWRPVLVLAGAVLVGSVIQDVFSSRWLSKREVSIRLALLLLALTVIGAIEWLRSGTLEQSVLLYGLAVATSFVFSAVLYIRLRQVLLAAAFLALSLLTFSSFAVLADSANRTWQTDRALAESFVYSSNFDDLNQRTSWPLSTRPPRWYVDFPPLNYAEATADVRYNRFWVTGEFGAVGNHNVKFSPVYQSIIEELDQGQVPLVNYLSTSSRQLIVEPDSGKAPKAELEACAASTERCNPTNMPVQVEMTSFDKEGETFAIQAKREFRMIQNEPFHSGWTYELCSLNANPQACERRGRAVVANGVLRAWDLPPGNYRLSTYFQTPAEPYRWWAAGVGVVLLFGFPLFGTWRLDPRRKDRVQNPSAKPFRIANRLR